MNAQEIIEYIRTSEKKTPVKVYVWEKPPFLSPTAGNSLPEKAARSFSATGKMWLLF